MMVRFRWRKSIRVGPLVFRFSNGGFAGWGIHIGRYRWNARTRAHHFDTPGLGGWSWSGRGRGRR